MNYSKRVKEIIDKKEIELKENYKIYWKDNPIEKLKKEKIIYHLKLKLLLMRL